MPPNVVVILCDQLRAHEVGCYGNDVIRTPHIDRLAAELRERLTAWNAATPWLEVG